jgi:outer membrane protein assembly factor BamE (lipoprotein component of BamABCDE complex)
MKIIYLLILFFFVNNCTLKEVQKRHGFYYLEKKQQIFVVNQTNKNDILEILGPPSSKSSFESDLWFYIERVMEKKKLLKFNNNEISVNNVLILEIDNKGLLINKNFLNKDDMNNLKFSTSATTLDYKKDTFIYNFLSSLRQKINDPLGKRKGIKRR